MERPTTESEPLSNMLTAKEMVTFIETRNVHQQDLAKIEELILILKSDREYFSSILPGDLHNFFSFEKEKSSQELEKMKQRINTPANWDNFINILVHFVNDYNYMTADHLLRTIRNIRLRDKTLFL